MEDGEIAGGTGFAIPDDKIEEVEELLNLKKDK